MAEAEGFGKGKTPESKPATNAQETSRDQERGLEILIAILLAMGRSTINSLALLPQADREKVVDHVVADASAKLIAVTRLLMLGQITTRSWLIQMRDILTASLAAGSMALLGKDQLSDAESESLVSETNLQYGYLVNYYREFVEGRQHVNQAMIGRADLYARAIWAVAWRVWVVGQLSGTKLFGLEIKEKPFGRRSLGVSEHCGDCVRWANDGWMPLEDVPPIGSSVCGPRCHCRIVVSWSHDQPS